MEPTNKQRIVRITKILNANYEGADDYRSSLVDLIADAFHFADDCGIDYAGVVRMAREHFNAETTGIEPEVGSMMKDEEEIETGDYKKHDYRNDY